MQQAHLERTRAVGPLALILCLGLLAPACGPEPSPGDAPPTASPVLPDLPPVPSAERAAFALERLLEGPQRRTARFPIPNLQELNLTGAQRDLVALPEETLRLLADDDLRRALARPLPDGFGRNGWHGILDVLARIKECSIDLALAWCEPAIETSDLQLHRRAVTVLAASPDAATAPVLLALLELRPTDRQLAPTAARALFEAGPPWRVAALETLLAAGDRRVWAKTGHLLASLEDPSVENALSWWALLAETGGPATVSETTRVLRPPWAVLGLLLRDDVWPASAIDLSLARRYGRVVAPASVLEAPGLMPHAGAPGGPLPWRTLLVDGRGAAAGARCALAVAGSQGARAGVEQDRRSLDPLLSAVAEACPVEGAQTLSALEAATILDLFLEALEAGETPDPVGVGQALRRLAELQPEELDDRARRVLALARPYSYYEKVILVAYDELRERDEARLLDTVTPWVNDEDPEQEAAALALARWSRDVRYAPAIMDGLDRASPAKAGARWRLLVWIWSAPKLPVPEAERAPFVERYVAWMATVGDAEASTLAPGLLDLGEVGSRAYAAGLQGERRDVFVRGLLTRSLLVPLEVAAALLAPLDAKTRVAERRAVLVAAYRTAPAAAAPHLAAARLRLDPSDRVEADDVLEAVRHRADR